MTRPAGTAVCYLRDSQGESDQSPVQYIPWARQQCETLKLAFRGDEATAAQMARSRTPEAGDLYMDYGVSGNLLSRPGLDALRRRVGADISVSHVLTPRRDRLARPDDPTDGLRLETELRRAGVTLVLLDQTLPPLAVGSRQDLGDLLRSMIDYEFSGRFRRELAQKLILAKVKLAEAGFSIGGDPPYGFRRWLTPTNGEPVRELARGERVRMSGHHVVLLPTARDELTTISRILGEIEATPAARIARSLNAEAIPSPAARLGGAGLWTPGAVRRVATHPLLSAVLEYGRRGEGDQLRFTPTGPRELTAADYGPDGRARRVANAEVVRVAAGFTPVVEPERRERVLAALDARGGRARGRPRSAAGVVNPLGGRVFDLACGWPMYRNAKRGGFAYSCGLYMNSDARECAHNFVSGEAATRFVLGAIRQRALAPDRLARLEARLRELAQAEAGRDRAAEQRAALAAGLAEAGRRRDRAGDNMALAATPEQYSHLSGVFERYSAEARRLESELRELPPPRPPAAVESEVCAALAGLGRLAELAADSCGAEGASALVRQVDAKLYLGFGVREVGRRRHSVPSHGVLTFGPAPAPCPLYTGPTDRAAIRQMAARGEPIRACPASVSREDDGPQAEDGGSGGGPRVTTGRA